MFKVFRDSPEAKVVYIAPMKALVRERIADWKQRFERQLGKKVKLGKFAWLDSGILAKNIVGIFVFETSWLAYILSTETN